jgi:TonB-dependent siderophore receptor
MHQGGRNLKKKHILSGVTGVVLSLFMLGSAMAAKVDGNSLESQEMVVTATRIEQDKMDVPFAVTVVTRSDIDRMGATTLEQALRTIPGLQMGVQGNAYPHIEVRGFRDTKDLAVLIDSVPFRQLNGSADLTMIPMGIVERIEFVKGPSSSIWGRGAVAGTINIITKPAHIDKLGATVQTRAGSFDTYACDARIVAPYSKGYAMINTGGSTTGGYQEGTDRDAQNLLMTVRHGFSDSFDLGVQYLFSNVNAKRGSTIPIADGEPAFGVKPEDNFALDNASYDGRYSALTLSPALALSDNIRIKNNFTVTRFDRYATGGTTVVAGESNKGWWESDSEQTGINNDLSLTLKQRTGTVDNTLLVGTYLEIATQEQYNPSYSWSSMPKYGPPDWQTPLTHPDNPPTGIKGATKKSDFDQKIFSAYAQDTLDFGRFSVMAGLRYDRFDEELKLSTTQVKADQSDSAWSPRFAFNWRMYNARNADISFFANYAEGFRTQLPKLSTKSGTTLPQLQDPEETKSYEAGIKSFFLDRRLFAQVSLFETKKKGPRSFRTTADDFLFTNARTKVTGIETEINYRVNAMVNLWGHYAYHDARYEAFKNQSGTSFEGNRVRMSPRHIAGAGVNIATRLLNWNVTANYVGERNLRDNTTGNLQELDPYVTVNTALTLPFKNFQIQFVMNNIFDEYYIADDFSSKDAGYPGEPRSYYVCLRGEF